MSAIVNTAVFFLIVFVVGILGVIGIDHALRQIMSAEPTIETYGSYDPTKRETLYFLLGPSGVKGSKVFPNLRHFLRFHGDVKEATYDPKRFKIATVVDGVLGHTAGYKRVVFVGLSVGYPVGFLTAEQLLALNTGQKVFLAGIDPVGTAATLKMGGSKVVKYALKMVAPGPILNLLSPLAGKLSFKPADITTIHPRNEWELRELWHSYRTYPLSGWRDELLAVHEFPGFHPLPGVKTGLVQSTNDTVVDSDKMYAEAQQIDPNLPRQRVHGTGHVAVLDEPDLFEAALERLLLDLALI